MLGVRASVKIFLVAVCVFALTREAMAAGPSAAPAVVSCAAVEQRADQAQRARSTPARRRAMWQRLIVRLCGDDLSSATQKLAATQSRVDSCQSSKDELCSEAAAFAQKLIDGKVTNVGSCVPGPAQVKLRQSLDDLENASKALGQLAEFGAGESDGLPVFAGSNASERLVARLLGPQREPFFYRRLLTEAVRLTAPRAWQQIRAGGPPKVEAWFASSDPSTSKLRRRSAAHVNAPRRDSAGHPSRRPCTSSGPISSSRNAATRRRPARAGALASCKRPSNPRRRVLLLRQRVEDIWAADCRNVTPGTVLAWVQDFPAPQAAASSGDFSEVARAAQAKLFTCFIGDSEGDTEPSFHAWLDKILPSPKALDLRSLPRVDDIRAGARDGAPLDVCSRAVRALQRVAEPNRCAALPADISAPIARWATEGRPADDASVPLKVCARYAEMLWLGQAVSGAGSFARPPTADTMLTLDKRAQATPLADLRTACEDRRGKPDSFPSALESLTTIARGFGEAPEGAPWRAEPRTGDPVEASRFDESSTFDAWVRHVTSRDSSCRALGISDARCERCGASPVGTFYDCDLNRRLERRWEHHQRLTAAAAGGFLALVVLVLWGSAHGACASIVHPMVEGDQGPSRRPRAAGSRRPDARALAVA